MIEEKLSAKERVAKLTATEKLLGLGCCPAIQGIEGTWLWLRNRKEQLIIKNILVILCELYVNGIRRVTMEGLIKRLIKKYGDKYKCSKYTIKRGIYKLHNSFVVVHSRTGNPYRRYIRLSKKMGMEFYRYWLDVIRKKEAINNENENGAN